MNGLQLTADAQGCRNSALLADAAALRSLCGDAVRASGLTPVGELFHAFPAPGGVTGVVLLAESHLALHTWPELRAVTLDVYVCNVRADHGAAAQALLERLLAAFEPAQVETNRLRRGALG